MRSTNTPKLVTDIIKKVTSLGLANSHKEDPSAAGVVIQATIPLFKHIFIETRAGQRLIRARRNGSRFFVSQGTHIVMVDAVQVADSFAYGLIPGPVGAQWLESISRVKKRRSIVHTLREIRILQVPEVHAEFLWLRLNGKDTLMRFDTDKGIVRGQAQSDAVPTVVELRAQLVRRIGDQQRTGIRPAAAKEA